MEEPDPRSAHHPGGELGPTSGVLGGDSCAEHAHRLEDRVWVEQRDADRLGHHGGWAHETLNLFVIGGASEREYAHDDQEKDANQDEHLPAAGGVEERRDPRRS